MVRRGPRSIDKIKIGTHILERAWRGVQIEECNYIRAVEKSILQ